MEQNAAVFKEIYETEYQIPLRFDTKVPESEQ
jgi:hypothetical protein